MSSGRLIAVVGASGVGKDSVMLGIAKAAPDLIRVRRTITRSADPDGEDHNSVTLEAFDAAVRRGAFCIHWAAHELRYGIPISTVGEVLNGKQCLVNFSRGALFLAEKSFPSVIVLNITANPTTLARRLSQRGRENEHEIIARLERKPSAIPKGLLVLNISNDGALNETISNVLKVLKPTLVI